MEFIYKGLEAEYQRHLVTEEEVNRQMERLRQQTPKIKVVLDRPAQMGDEVVLDYAGFCDGVQFEGGTAEKQTLVLGSGMFIPGFETQLIGAKVGDKVNVQVTFPEQYHAENLAGMPAEFRCVIHEIREKGAHELDDEFAAAMGLETMEQLHAELRRSMQQFADERGEMDLRDQLIRKAARTFEYEVSAGALASAVDEQMRTLRNQLEQQGLTMEMYCKFSGTTEEKMREDIRPEAEQTVRIRAAIERIVELEGIVVTEEDKAGALQDICRKNRVTMEELKSIYDEDFEEVVVSNLQMEKAMEFVRRHAVIKETVN